MNNSSEQELKLVFNVPNTVTAVRVVMAGVIAWLLWQHLFLAAGILIVVAASTDWLDGFLARRLRQETPGGVIFDLVADEIFFMPSLILAIVAGVFSKTDSLMPWNPYPYAVLALAGGVAVLAGVGTYLWKRRTRSFEFPSPTGVAKVNFTFWLAPLVVAVFYEAFGVGPDSHIGLLLLLAVLMYFSIISTLLTFYSYLKKGSYVFTD